MPVNGLHKDQKNPDFTSIIKLATHELDIKYEQYGNSWLDSPEGYWDKRLFNEIEEFKKGTSQTVRKRKLLNIINIAAMAFEADKGNPKSKIITLCGSTKFFKEFDDVMLKLTLAGWAVFTIGTHRFSDHDLPEVNNVKYMLDKMHKRKIDMSEAIFVIDVDEYQGISTRSEIMHAYDTGKSVYFLSRKNDLEKILNGEKTNES